MTTQPITLQALNKVLWDAANSSRSTVDAGNQQHQLGIPQTEIIPLANEIVRLAVQNRL